MLMTPRALNKITQNITSSQDKDIDFFTYLYVYFKYMLFTKYIPYFPAYQT